MIKSCRQLITSTTAYCNDIDPTFGGINLELTHKIDKLKCSQLKRQIAHSSELYAICWYFVSRFFLRLFRMIGFSWKKVESLNVVRHKFHGFHFICTELMKIQ